jgi:hypothetical protein
MMAQLQQVLAAQMQIGLPLGLVTRENIHATNAEIAKLAGFANPDKFWPDPGKLPPQQNPLRPIAVPARLMVSKFMSPCVPPAIPQELPVRPNLAQMPSSSAWMRKEWMAWSPAQSTA